MWPLFHLGAIWRNFIFSDHLFSLWFRVFPLFSRPGGKINANPEEKNTRIFFFFAAWRKKNRMHVRPIFCHFSSFGMISWPIDGKLVFSLRCNKQYVHLGQHCWFFSLLFGHSESGFALPSCPKNRENKTANIALGAQLLYCTSGKKHSFSSLNAFTRKIAISHRRENKWTENMKCGLYFT